MMSVSKLNRPRRQEEDEHEGAVCQGQFEAAFVAMPHTFELVFKTFMDMPDPAICFFGCLACGGLIERNLSRQHVMHHGRDQRAGEEIGGEHGKHDGHGERGEEIFCGAG